MALAQIHRVPSGRAAVVDGDLLDLDARAKRGDPVAGWRGDPSMHVFVVERVDRVTGLPYPAVQVCALDAHGETYVACEVDASKQGWKHEALSRLVEGDWQRGDHLLRSVERHNAAIEADAQRRYDDWLEGEGAPKLKWALQRDGVVPRDRLFVPGQWRGKS